MLRSRGTCAAEFDGLSHRQRREARHGCLEGPARRRKRSREGGPLPAVRGHAGNWRWPAPLRLPRWPTTIPTPSAPHRSLAPPPACAPRRPTGSPALARVAPHAPHLGPAAHFPLAASVCSLLSPRPLSSCPVPCSRRPSDQMIIAASVSFLHSGRRSIRVVPGLHLALTRCQRGPSGLWVTCSARPAAHLRLSDRSPLTAAFLLPSHPRVSTRCTMEDEVTPVSAHASTEAPPRAAAGERTPLLPAPAATGAGKKKGGSRGASDVRAFKDDE